MAEFKARIEAEFENIERALAELPANNLSKLSILELAGVAAIIHSVYNGIENIIKQAVLEKGLSPPRGESWHRDLAVSGFSTFFQSCLCV